VKKYINQFWSWYEDNLHININVAAFLFVMMQLKSFYRARPHTYSVLTFSTCGLAACTE